MNFSTTAKELIISFLQSDQFDEAIQVCDQQQDIHQNAELMQLKAMAICQKGELEKAKNIFLQAIQIKPNDPTLLYNYSEVLLDCNDTSGAKSVLKKICDKHPQFEPAQKKLLSLGKAEGNIQNQDEKEEGGSPIFNLERSFDPLNSAFSLNEVKKTQENHAERQKKSNQLNLREKPVLPSLEDAVLADEWLLAAEDALRANQAELSLKLCSKAMAISTNPASIYALAGDCYLAINQHNYSQLCYLLSAQFTELDLPRQINLVSLAQSLGDKYLSEKRRDALEPTLQNQGSMLNTLKKVVERHKTDCNVQFLPDKGPCRELSSI